MWDAPRQKVQTAGMKVIVRPAPTVVASESEQLLYRMASYLLEKLGGSVVIEDKELVLFDPKKQIYCEQVIGGTKVILK